MNQKKDHKEKCKIKNIIFKIIFTVGYLGLVFGLGEMGASCLFLKFIHIPCPGCGMTRALLSALKFDFVEAFQYHGMFWSIPILYGYFWLDGNLTGNKKADKIIFIIIAIGFLINWLAHLPWYISV